MKDKKLADHLKKESIVEFNDKQVSDFPALTKTDEVLTKDQSKAIRDAKSQLQLQMADIINRKKQLDNDLSKINSLVQSLDKMFK